MNEVFENNVAITSIRNFYMNYRKVILGIAGLAILIISAYLINNQIAKMNNLEAAEEIARQLRLRDIGGIIVIDFIDMETQRRQQELLNKFKQELAKDKTRTQVFEISRLGLVEMTRKNVSAGLIESFSDECEECNGRGLIIGDIFSNNSVDTDLLETDVVVE